jgi:small basic protein (TIGR04137 family)
MSIHKSLVTAGKLRRHRNVLTRSERLDILKKEERWKENQSIFGLPKVRNIMLKAKKKKEEAAAEGTEAAPAAGAVPAAGAAPAAAGGKGAAPAAAGKGAAGAKGAAPAAAPAKGAAPAKKEEKKK